MTSSRKRCVGFVAALPAEAAALAALPAEAAADVVALPGRAAAGSAATLPTEAAAIAALPAEAAAAVVEALPGWAAAGLVLRAQMKQRLS